jgi:hypothetical protein
LSKKQRRGCLPIGDERKTAPSEAILPKPLRSKKLASVRGACRLPFGEASNDVITDRPSLCADASEQERLDRAAASYDKRSTQGRDFVTDMGEVTRAVSVSLLLARNPS